MAGKKQFPLRLDPQIYEALEQWAADEFRSVNSHIEFLLRDSLKRAGRFVSAKSQGNSPKDGESE